MSDISMKRAPLILRNHQFLRLWLGQVLSQSCSRMFQIALMWWIISHALSGGGKQAAIFLVLGAIPSVLLARKIGNTVDSRAAKPILVTADLLAALVLIAIALCLHNDQLTFAVLYFSGFLLASFQAFYDPTLNKALPELVRPDDLESAIALMTSTQSIANFGGAVMGAILIDGIGAFGVACLNTAGYLVALLCNLSIRFPKQTTHPAKEEPGADKDSTKDRASIFVLLDDLPLIKKVLIGFGLINFFSTPTLVVLPLYVKNQLHASASTLGLLEASLWIGLVFGAYVSKWIRFSSNTVLIGAVCLLGLGVCIAVPGIFINVTACTIALFFAGSMLGINNVKFISLFQSTIPAQIKGRFFAGMQALIGFTMPLAFFVFGAGADLIAPNLLFVIQGLGISFLSLFFFRLAASNATTTSMPIALEVDVTS